MKNIYKIKSKKELFDFIEADKKACFGNSDVSFEKKIRNPFKRKLFKFFKLLRKYEYLCYKRDSATCVFFSKSFSLLVKLYDIKKNKLSLELNVEIKPFCCGKGIRICHPNVIINGYVGDNCIFHGNNVIGNKKTGEKDLIPKIGCNADIGAGAIIIGNIVVADNCVIGAGSVVTKSFTVPGGIIAGVPAREINGEV